MRKILILLGLVLALSTSIKGQTSVAIQNPSFEDVTFLPNNTGHGNWNTGPVPGWTFAGNGGIWQPTTDRFPTIPDGTQVLYLSGGTVTQDLNIPVSANGTYALSVLVGQRLDGLNNNYTISLYAGATLIPGCSQTASNSAITPGTFSIQTLSCVITTPPTGDLIVSLESDGSQVDFDNVNLMFTPTNLPVTLNINSGSAAVYDDQTPILPGSITISQQQNSTTTNTIGTITSDSSGNLTGSLTVNPNWTDANGNLTFLFGLPIAPNLLIYPVPIAELQHGSTGLTINLVLFKQGPLAVKSQTLAVTP